MECKRNVGSPVLQDLECEICFVEYDSEYVVPMMLKCGHTYCDVCIKDLLYKSPKCPACRAPISVKDSVKNYALLKLLSDKKPKSKCYKDVKKELESLRRELMSKRDDMVKYRDLYEKNVSILDTNLCQVDELLEGKSEDLDRDSSLHIIIEVKKTLRSFNEADKPLPRLFATPISDVRDYVLKIYRKIESGGKLLSVHQANYESKLIYGKISNWSNALCFHCLHLADAEDCQEFLRFDDLKKVTSSLKLKLFLKIPCKTQANKVIMIEPTKSSLVTQFIRFCTGETGYSYREASFVEGEDRNKYCKSIMKVSHYKKENESKDDMGCDDVHKGSIDYAFESSFQYVFKEPTAVVVGSADGGFQIFYSYSKTSYKNVIGVVESSMNLQDISYEDPRILDCGLAFEL
ncbi:UNVERIFIED_CONTAM: hypothetical protein RMT77_012932 [Armadillidium vulgare]